MMSKAGSGRLGLAESPEPKNRLQLRSRSRCNRLRSRSGPAWSRFVPVCERAPSTHRHSLLVLSCTHCQHPQQAQLHFYNLNLLKTPHSCSLSQSRPFLALPHAVSSSRHSRTILSALECSHPQHPSMPGTCSLTPIQLC